MLDFAEWLESTRVSDTLRSIDWIIPLVQSIHILMIGIVFVSILIIVLRILELIRMEQAFESVWRRFAPWVWSALAVMVVTGVLLIVAEPVRQLASTSFWLKMALLLVGVAGAVFFGRSVVPAAAGDYPDFSAGTRLAAAGTVVLWLGIIFLGRAIAYDVEVWGSLALGN